MRPQLFDTSALIPMVRGEAYEELFLRSLRTGRARMSSVVMQELYAGARSRGDKRDLDEIHRWFTIQRYVVNPEHADWVHAGLMLARYQRLHGSVEPKDHINDILIVLDAVRVGADLVTENGDDMERWRKLLPFARRALRIQVVRRENHR
jgi:predicted nucleic acid-binding protein